MSRGREVGQQPSAIPPEVTDDRADSHAFGVESLAVRRKRKHRQADEQQDTADQEHEGQNHRMPEREQREPRRPRPGAGTDSSWPGPVKQRLTVRTIPV